MSNICDRNARDLRATSPLDEELSSPELLSIPEKNRLSEISMPPQKPLPLPINNTHLHPSPIVPICRNESPISFHIYYFMIEIKNVLYEMDKNLQSLQYDSQRT
jgi:hypothetical protein